MQQRSAGPAPAASGERFDGERARRILERAAREQHSIDTAVAESFSRDELQQVAAEVGISAAALDAAIAAEREQRSAGARASGERPPHRNGGIGRWFARQNATALAVFGFVAVAVVLIGLWIAAPTLFWVTSLSLTLAALLILMVGSSW